MVEQTEVAVEQAEATVEEKNDNSSECAILFELENVSIAGRDIRYKAIEKVLSGKSVKISPVLYSRYGVDVSLKQFLVEMFSQAGKKITSEDKLLADTLKAIGSALASSSAKPSSAVNDLIKQAEKMKITVGALSAADKATSEKLASKVGLSDKEHLLSCADGDRDCATADAWLKLAKKLSMQPAACAVIATSAMSCKAALSAGMWCMAIPDKYTNFQDFSGVDHVVETLDAESVKAALELLEQRL
jgi:beta-phosphoglucomutase-like phosphatase (HAD superfamily)